METISDKRPTNTTKFWTVRFLRTLTVMQVAMLMIPFQELKTTTTPMTTLTTHTTATPVGGTTLPM